jgi:pyruvate dehydrogenase E2 component (dihydrolipoamide acetyltransferase)
MIRSSGSTGSCSRALLLRVARTTKPKSIQLSKQKQSCTIMRTCNIHFRQQQRFAGTTAAATTNLLNNQNQLTLHSLNNSSLLSFHKTVSTSILRSYTSTSTVFDKEYPPHTIYPMPALSPTMELGTITSWNINVGDEFIAGTSLCTVETDKASVDFEAQDDGILAKILRQGTTAIDIKIGTPICVIVENSNDVSAFADYVVPSDDTPPTASAVAAAVSSPSISEPATTAATASPGTSMLLPSARHLSESKGLDATVLIGTGKGGRVTKGDVMTAIETGTLPPLSKKVEQIQPAAATPTVAAVSAPATSTSITPVSSTTYSVPEIMDNTFVDTPNNKMRKIIASRLTESKRDVPHFYTSMDVELDNIMKLRKTLAKTNDIKVSVNDFVIRCSALALRDVPYVNSMYDSKTDTIQYQKSIDISVAVATPTGLITPIVFNTDTLGLYDISLTVKDLATRARDGKLAPHEFQGGTFTISNLGMFGINEFSAVINPPQAAILAVGGGTKSFVATQYNENQSTTDKIPPKIRTIMTARLSADRRVVDEAVAGQFVQALRHYINTPELLLL